MYNDCYSEDLVLKLKGPVSICLVLYGIFSKWSSFTFQIKNTGQEHVCYIQGASEPLSSKTAKIYNYFSTIFNSISYLSWS